MDDIEEADTDEELDANIDEENFLKLSSQS